MIHALGHKVSQGMINIGLVPFVAESGGEALRQANLTVNTPSQEGTKVR